MKVMSLKLLTLKMCWGKDRKHVSLEYWLLHTLCHWGFVDWNHKMERGLLCVGNAHLMTRIISLQVVFEFWLGFWTQSGRRGGVGGENVAGSFFLSTEFGCQHKLQWKRSHFFGRKNSDSKLDEQYETVVQERQELIPAKEIVRAGFPFPFFIHISLMLLSWEGAGKSSRNSNSPFSWDFCCWVCVIYLTKA